MLNSLYKDKAQVYRFTFPALPMPGILAHLHFREIIPI